MDRFDAVDNLRNLFNGIETSILQIDSSIKSFILLSTFIGQVPYSLKILQI
eukprot:UN07815